MRRREFVKLIGGTLAAWPLSSRAQQAQGSRTVGYLGQSSADAEAHRLAAFVQRMGELGWIEGRNVAVDVRWTDGRAERAEEIVADFVRLKVDAIVTSGTPQTAIAKRATSAIPIVFATAGDPVGAGLVGSLARPSGNVTGFSVLATDLAGKRIELLREAIPGLRRLGILGNVGNSIVAQEMNEFHAAAGKLGLDAVMLEIRAAEDIEPAFRNRKGDTEAIYVCQDLLTLTNRSRISKSALETRLPAMFASREHIEAGSLMSYGPNFLDLYRRTAEYVDRILRGTKPADLPVEQPTKFELVVNVSTARNLGINLPPTLIARADEVIE
jgi:putative ABC transport system substrate-binding protein